MSGARNINAPVLIGLALLLFVVMPLVRKLEGVKPPVDPLAGEWVGTVTFHPDEAVGIWGNAPGPHERAVLKVILREYDTDLERYLGHGEMYVVGELTPRPIEMHRVQADKDGSIQVELWMGSFSDMYHGTLTGNAIAWPVQDRLGLSAELHRGTDADYQRLLHAAS